MRLLSQPVLRIQLLELAEEFFALKSKESYATDSVAGYQRFASEIHQGASSPDPKECYHILGNEKDIFPSDDFRNRAHATYQSLERIAKEQLQSILPEDRFKKFDLTQGGSVLRFIHYPVVTTTCSAEHTDLGFLTLAVASREGLEVYTSQDWLRIPDDALVVMSGQLLEKITAGGIHADRHRVVQTSEVRYAASFFYQPDMRMKLPSGQTAGEFLQAGVRSVSANKIYVLE